jgi:hypothetical protein
MSARQLYRVIDVCAFGVAIYHVGYCFYCCVRAPYSDKDLFNTHTRLLCTSTLGIAGLLWLTGRRY